MTESQEQVAADETRDANIRRTSARPGGRGAAFRCGCAVGLISIFFYLFSWRQARALVYLLKIVTFENLANVLYPYCMSATLNDTKKNRFSLNITN